MIERYSRPEMTAIWAEQNTVLQISAKHKSIARYLGPEPEFLGQEKPHFKTILAEIVADQVARRIIELREEKQGHDPDFSAYALYLDHQKLLGEFSNRENAYHAWNAWYRD